MTSDPGGGAGLSSCTGRSARLSEDTGALLGHGGTRDRARVEPDLAETGSRRALSLGREQADLGAVRRERVGLARGPAERWRRDLPAHVETKLSPARALRLHEGLRSPMLYSRA